MLRSGVLSTTTIKFTCVGIGSGASNTVWLTINIYCLVAVTIAGIAAKGFVYSVDTVNGRDSDKSCKQKEECSLGTHNAY